VYWNGELVAAWGSCPASIVVSAPAAGGHSAGCLHQGFATAFWKARSVSLRRRLLVGVPAGRTSWGGRDGDRLLIDLRSHLFELSSNCSLAGGRYVSLAGCGSRKCACSAGLALAMVFPIYRILP